MMWEFNEESSEGILRSPLMEADDDSYMIICITQSTFRFKYQKDFFGSQICNYYALLLVVQDNKKYIISLCS